MKNPKPDDCTTWNPCKPCDYCRKCSHAIYRGQATVNGRTYRWEHNGYHGPLFSRFATGDCNWTPNPRHLVWLAFQAWYDRKFGTNTATKERNT